MVLTQFIGKNDHKKKLFSNNFIVIILKTSKKVFSLLSLPEKNIDTRKIWKKSISVL